MNRIFYLRQTILPLFVLAGVLFVLTNIAMKISPMFRSSAQKAVVLQSKQFDVVAVGAGPGGIAASIQAARMGARVALVEETDWVGGQMTAAGVGSMDEGHSMVRKVGIYKEFIQQVLAYYQAHGKSVNTCYYGEDNVCVDPRIGHEILRKMLKQESANLELYTGMRVSKVLRKNTLVTGVVAGTMQFNSKVVIDASEYGDILDWAGADYRIGNGTCIEPKKKACIQDISYVAVIKHYPNGVPDRLKFRRPPPDYTPEVVKHFAAHLTKNGNDHLIDPHYPLSFQSYTAFRGFPDLANSQNYDGYQRDGHSITRTALIMANDYPSNFVLSGKFLTDASFRKESTCKAKLLTLQLIYYIQHDLGQSKWSIADDEGYDTPYAREHHCPLLNGYEAFEYQMAQEPYVRESKRLIGLETLTGNELQYAWKDKTRTPTFPNSIAVGHYPMDVHDCKTGPTLEAAFDSVANLSTKYAGGGFEVPIGVLIPQKVDGLLAAEKNISVSRLANGAIREQPIAMDIGQAAGALAALATSQGQQPRNIPYQQVQTALLQGNAIFTLDQAKERASSH